MVEVCVCEGGYGHRNEPCASQGIIEFLCLEGASNGPASLQAIYFSVGIQCGALSGKSRRFEWSF